MKNEKNVVELIWATIQLYCDARNCIVIASCGQQLYCKRSAVGLGEDHDTVSVSWEESV